MKKDVKINPRIKILELRLAFMFHSVNIKELQEKTNYLKLKRLFFKIVEIQKSAIQSTNHFL